MTSSGYADFSKADQYVVGHLAARDHVPAEELAQLPRTKIDEQIPGARQAYERREETAAELLQRLGIDPTTPQYQAAAQHARDLLDHIDSLDSGDAA